MIEKKILTSLLQQTQEVTFRTLQKKTAISPRILKSHLEQLAQKGVVKVSIADNWKLGKKVDNRPRLISITRKGQIRLAEKTTIGLEEICELLQISIGRMMMEENIMRWRSEGAVPLPKRWPTNTDPKAPARMAFMTEAEWREFYEHREKVFGKLHDRFFSLAQVVAKAAAGSVMVEDDLSNVTVRFRNKRAVWTVDGS